MVRALSLFSKLGDQPPMRIICGVALGFGLLSGNKRLARAGGRMIAAHTLATLAKDLIKNRIDRTRPELLLEENRYKMGLGSSEASENSSFPSGHSAGAVAVGRAFAREYPEYSLPAQAASILIALGQIPRCKHYPTDVAAGSALGAISEFMVDGFLRTLAKAREGS